jgi:tripartite-type tricarboxylate transporter receptor subunit TctC
MIQSGRVRPLGVTTPKRAAMLPDVPAIGETVKGYQMFGWYSLVAPTGTPAAILEKANAASVAAVKEPEFTQQLKMLGIDVVASSRAGLDTFRREERKRITELVKGTDIDVK